MVTSLSTRCSPFSKGPPLRMYANVVHESIKRLTNVGLILHRCSETPCKGREVLRMPITDLNIQLLPATLHVSGRGHYLWSVGKEFHCLFDQQSCKTIHKENKILSACPLVTQDSVNAL